MYWEATQKLDKKYSVFFYIGNKWNNFYNEAVVTSLYIVFS